MRHSIEQIENLALPKRGDRRRNIYLGEQVVCWIKIDKKETQVEVIDLSPRGLALVETLEKLDFPFVDGQKVSLTFAKGLGQAFMLEGVVRNVSPLSVRSGKKLQRIGIQFSTRLSHSVEGYFQLVAEPIVLCRSYIRPQAFCFDPFFFQEVVLFHVNAFTATGADLTVSARCKSILPHQPLSIDFYLPGRGRFLVNVVNSDVSYRTAKGQYRLYVKFIRPEKSFLEAVSEYLVMFSPDAYPNRLRELGFHVGELSYAFELGYAAVSEDFLQKKGLEPAPLALPASAGESLQLQDKHARTLSCKFGPHLVASLRLVFVEGKPARSKLQAYSHTIQAEVIRAKHIELTDLYVSSKIMLSDLLLPLLQHVVRIAIQAGASYLLLESTAQLRSILTKIGFKDHGSQTRRKGKGEQEITLYVWELPIKKAILNDQKFLPNNVWQKVYRELYEFFKKQQKQRIKK